MPYRPDVLLLRRRRMLVVGSISSCLLLLLASVRPAAADELRRDAIVRAVQNARSAVVNIHGQKTLAAAYDPETHAEAARRVNGMGTGVIVDERGYIITNQHVVQGVRRIQVTLASGQTHFAKLVSHDPRSDLAVIKINVPESLPTIPVGTSSDLMPGETVIAVGNAYGYEHTVTRGIISALHRTVQINDTQQYEDLIQTDASINPGNSGGPLLNIDGNMIGLNVAVRAGAQGIGFAIPVDKVLEAMADLLSVQKVDSHWHGLAMKDKLPDAGALVAQVSHDSPAARGGFLPGDLITRVGQHRVGHAFDFERLLLGRKAGEAVDVVVKRSDREVKLSLALSQRPDQLQVAQQRAWDELGLRVTPLTGAALRQLNSRYRGGLEVSEVREDSPAAREGIRSGDVLVGMHVWETVSLENLLYVLNRLENDEIEPLKFYIVRGEETLYGHLSLARTESTSR